MVNCSNHSIILSKYFGMICKFVTYSRSDQPSADDSSSSTMSSEEPPKKTPKVNMDYPTVDMRNSEGSVPPHHNDGSATMNLDNSLQQTELVNSVPPTNGTPQLHIPHVPPQPNGQVFCKFHMKCCECIFSKINSKIHLDIISFIHHSMCWSWKCLLLAVGQVKNLYVLYLGYDIMILLCLLVIPDVVLAVASYERIMMFKISIQLTSQ